MTLLELSSIVLILGMALPERVGMIAETARAVDAALASAAESCIGAAIESTAVAKVRGSTTETSAMEPTESPAVEATKAAAKCPRPFNATDEAHGSGGARQQRDGQLVTM
jgi:hypothetical protein